MARLEESLFDRWPALVVRWRTPLLLVAMALSVLAWGPANRLRFDQSIETLYSQDSPVLHSYQQSKLWFGGDEIGFLTFTDPDLYSEKSQNNLRQLSQKVANVPGIERASVQDISSAMIGSRIPLVAIPENELKELFRGILVGDDDRTTAVVMRFLPEMNSPVPRSRTIELLNKIAAENSFPTYVVGEPVLVYESFRYVADDGFWLWVLSSILLMLVILGLLRDFRWTLLPILVVGAAVLWTRGLLGLSGMNLTMVSSTLNSLVTIIGIATVMHIALRFREKRRMLPPQSALNETIQELAGPILWTTATTALGFFVLVSSSINPVQGFGMMMTMGTLVVIPALLLIVPQVSLLGLTEEPLPGTDGEDWFTQRLGWLSASILKYPNRIWTTSLLMIGIALSGFLFLKVETDFSKNFRSDTLVVRGLDFMEQRLGGSGAWEVNFPAPEKLTYDFLNKVRNFARELEALRGSQGNRLTKVIALSDAVDLVPRIPFISFSLEKRISILRRIQPDFESSLYNSQAGRMRIVLRALERQSAEAKNELMDLVRQAATRHFPESEVTGLYVILTYLIESLMFDQWLSFMLAAVGIFLLMWIAFGSLWLGLISLVPNLFPIIFVMGIMGWIGMPVNMATAMIASVSMGLTVDSGIHYLASFQAARRAGKTFDDSLQIAQQGVGRALIIANLALIAGFLGLTLSHFVPLIYFGLLVSVAMLGGLIGNLLLLPLLMRSGRSEWCDHRHYTRTKELVSQR